jgi:Cu(I)/Ag(I) efflux system protein CusF
MKGRKMKSTLLLIALLTAPLTPAYADGDSMPMQMPGGHDMPKQAAGGQGMAMPMAEGVVRRIDLSNGKITLKHGPIANLDMQPMTMVYPVKPPMLLNKLKVGDKVKFHAEAVNGNYIVTAIEVVR